MLSSERSVLPQCKFYKIKSNRLVRSFQTYKRISNFSRVSDPINLYIQPHNNTLADQAVILEINIQYKKSIF